MYVQDDQDHERLDRVLAAHLNMSRQQAQSKIKKGLVRLDGQVLKASFLVQKGQTLTILPEDIATNRIDHGDLPPVSLLYEDESLLVVDKPRGLVSQPAETVKEPTLVDALQALCPSLSDPDQVSRFGLVHRLDRDTAGVMVVAKTHAAQAHLMAQFQDRLVTKRYYAMLKGNLAQDHDHLHYPLGRHPSKRHLRWVLESGDAAHTSYRVLQRFNSKTLVDIDLMTGRTHQIRVHMAYIGHPVIGDQAYDTSARSGGQQLQSYCLSFSHPIYGQRWTFQLPMASFF